MIGYIGIIAIGVVVFVGVRRWCMDYSKMLNDCLDFAFNMDPEKDKGD